MKFTKTEVAAWAKDLGHLLDLHEITALPLLIKYDGKRLVSNGPHGITNYAAVYAFPAKGKYQIGYYEREIKGHYRQVLRASFDEASEIEIACRHDLPGYERRLPLPNFQVKNIWQKKDISRSVRALRQELESLAEQ